MHKSSLSDRLNQSSDPRFIAVKIFPVNAILLSDVAFSKITLEGREGHGRSQYHIGRIARRLRFTAAFRAFIATVACLSPYSTYPKYPGLPGASPRLYSPRVR